jgi:hypothetical protein
MGPRRAVGGILWEGGASSGVAPYLKFSFFRGSPPSIGTSSLASSEDTILEWGSASYFFRTAQIWLKTAIINCNSHFAHFWHCQPLTVGLARFQYPRAVNLSLYLPPTAPQVIHSAPQRDLLAIYSQSHIFTLVEPQLPQGLSPLLASSSYADNL